MGKSEFDKFAEDLRQEVIYVSEAEGEESFREETFTRLMIDYLIDAQELDEGEACMHRAHGVQVNGYSVSENEDCLDMFVSIYSGSLPPETVKAADLDNGFRRLLNFVKRCFNRYHDSLEEASSVYDMAERIHSLKGSLNRIRLFLFTDGVIRRHKISDEEFDGIRISYYVWDIERLYRWWSSGKQRESLEVEFETSRHPVNCLKMPGENDDYVSYLAFFPGDVLCDIYNEHGPRLLERNVRSFLQARGKINQGIRKTILSEPHMFLAYNNGLTATAEKVTVEESNESGLVLKSASDFQIVNGGQTTASIFHARKKDKADLSKLIVQVKLTVLKDPMRVDDIVPLISMYANSQNKVQTADFFANDPFHRKIEELSRTIWAPAVDGGQRQTRWFYERARGQYLDAKSRESTPARKRNFDASHPVSQKFTKTDLAKYENTWNQLPQIASRGAQKNFQDFTIRLKERGNFTPTEEYFMHLVAKAILFKKAEKIVQAQKYGGYRANIMYYTLAWLSRATRQCIDLGRIWRTQGITQEIEDTIRTVSKYAFKHITNPPNGANITEWCKKDQCWNHFKDVAIPISEKFKEQLIKYGKSTQGVSNKGTDAPDETEIELIKEIMKVTSDQWFALSSWAKETKNLAPWQRSLAFSLGRLATNSKEPSRKQATQGKKILEQASQKGFSIQSVHTE